MCLAICDALQPNVIWEELKFDKICGSNLIEEDFFSLLFNLRQGKPLAFQEGFDVIIGNPPFESGLSESGTKINREVQNQEEGRGALPDKQSAYLFLEQIFSILHSNGRVCLIQPSGILYNRNTQNFRAHLFGKHEVNSVLDFVSIRKLYEGADSKTVAILAQYNKPPDEHRITHLTFRRTISVKEHICFEIDHYDRQYVFQKQIEKYPDIWRYNLLGGGRLFDISQRFQNTRNLSEYINQKGWDYGEGFIIGKKNEQGQRKPAPFLTGKPFLPTNAFTDKGINEGQISEIKETLFHTAYTENRYSSPIVLIKKKDSLPIVFWDKGFIAYKHRIIGISAPNDQVAELREIYNTISRNHDIYRLFCVLNGTSLVGHATTFLKDDIDRVPYPEDLNELSLSFWEEALCEDTLKFFTDYIRLGQNSELLTQAANTDDLLNYSKMFVQMLGSIYDNLKAAVPIFSNGLTCQPFYFGEPPDLSWIYEQPEYGLREIIYDDKYHANLRTIRILRIYSDNFLLLIKPDRLRYWIQSTAIRDADETIIDLRRQGY